MPNNYGVPSVSVTSYTSTGGQTNLPQDRWTNHFQFTDAITWIHGPHTFKFGFDMTHVKSTEYEVTSGRGSVTFSNSPPIPTTATAHAISPAVKRLNVYGTTEYAMGDMLLGLPSSTVVDAIAHAIYLQPVLVLRFICDGRLEGDTRSNPQPRSCAMSSICRSRRSTARIVTFVPSKGNDGTSDAFITAAQAGSKSLYQTDHHSFAPRIGFSWQPLHNDKTVVKGAFGTFYQEPILYNQFLNYSLAYPIRTPYSFTSGAVNPAAGTIAASATTLTLNQAFNSADIAQRDGRDLLRCRHRVATQPTAAAGCPAPCGLTPVITGTYIDPKYGNPYWDEWSLSIERQITRTTLVEVGYYGSKGSQIAYSGTAPLNYNTLGRRQRG